MTKTKHKNTLIRQYQLYRSNLQRFPHPEQFSLTKLVIDYLILFLVIYPWGDKAENYGMNFRIKNKCCITGLYSHELVVKNCQKAQIKAFHTQNVTSKTHKQFYLLMSLWSEVLGFIGKTLQIFLRQFVTTNSYEFRPVI